MRPPDPPGTAVRDDPTYVLDTNVLIADPEAPGFQEHDVAIPLTVVEELDKLKTRPDETGASARRAIRPWSASASRATSPRGSRCRAAAASGRGQPRLSPGPARGPVLVLDDN